MSFGMLSLLAWQQRDRFSLPSVFFGTRQSLPMGGVFVTQPPVRDPSVAFILSAPELIEKSSDSPF
jgi:hypothetical protein